ncbi:21377_t:CDS:10, partial [Gigaspora rosea]
KPSTTTVNEWKNRTIYQLLTDRFAQTPGQENPALCATNKENEGFDAIWISPVDKQVENETIYGVGWHGYWAQDKFSINPHFGTTEELKNLVDTAHQKGIWVMIDVVANHMGPQQGKEPGTADYVKIYNRIDAINDYHKYCDACYCDDRQNIEYCSIGGHDLPLPENPETIGKLNTWIHELVSTYKFDGIRIDTVKHVRSDFWNEFIKYAGVFSIGEIYDFNVEYVARYQQGGHVDATLNYPLYQKISELYSSPFTNMYELRDRINENRQYFVDTLALGNFVDNHDTERYMHRTPDHTLTRNALSFVLLYDGTEQHFTGFPTGLDPFNREALWSSNYVTDTPMFKFISTLNLLRRYLPPAYYNSLAIEAWVDTNIYAFVKDKLLVITMNYGSGEGSGWWAVGEELINVVNCTEKVLIDTNGNVSTDLYGEPKIFYPVNKLIGMDLKSQKDGTLLELLVATDELLLQPLTNSVQNFLSKNSHIFLQQSPVKMLHFIVHNDRFNELKEAYLETICKNPSLIFDSEEFPSLEEDALKLILNSDNLDMKEGAIWKKLIQWGIAQHTTLESKMTCEDTNNEAIKILKETLHELIKFIRFYQMDRKDFIPEVWDYKEILPNDLIKDILHCYLDSDIKPLHQPFLIRWGNFKIDSVLINKEIALLLTKWIDKKSSDDKTSKGFRYNFNLLFRCSVDGASSKTFHQKCNNKGATIVVARIQNSSLLVGGYNPLDWNGDNVWKETTSSFIFTLDHNDLNKASVSRVNHDNSDCAIGCDDSHGPSFGEGPDLHVPSNSSTWKFKIKSYPKLVNSNSFTISNYEVFQVERVLRSKQPRVQSHGHPTS